jgi:integrase/recombinase XerD
LAIGNFSPSPKTGCPNKYVKIAFSHTQQNILRERTMKQAKTLTERELKLVLAHCATRRHAARDRLAVLLGHWAGLRAKEIAALKLHHVQSNDGTIRDSFLLTADETKGRKARRVFVSTRLQKEIGLYIKSVHLRKVNPHLLQSQKGLSFSPNTMCQLLCQIYKDCRIDGASSHSGRRNFLTSLSAKGVSARVLQELAGHANLATTQRYIDVNDRQMRNAVEMI